MCHRHRSPTRPMRPTPSLTRELNGAGDEDRTRITSLEGWGSAIELRPRRG
jgi:hypothetical protein